jgi:UDP-glucose 4-epimerase
MKVLITGGAGFIGSTIASACLDAGHLPIVLDDLSTGVEAFVRGRIFYHGDIADARLLDGIFLAHPDIDAVIHCASHIVVPDSVADPLRYYRNNVCKTIDLVEHLDRVGCRRLIFSSSASMYAVSDDFIVDEGSPLDPQSPYARSKAMVEQILADAARAGLIDVVSLRYFNPVGADPALRSGQQLARPTHALGKLLAAYEDQTTFTVTGADWPTRDGSAIRDYVHVWDVARAHVRALEVFDRIAASSGGFGVVNVGTGRGTTVRELVKFFEEATGTRLAVMDGPRRPGDVVGAYARVDKARTLFGWSSHLTIIDAIRDAVAWSAVREDVLRTRGSP